MTRNEFAAAIAGLGGKAYLVGGSVRDRFMHKVPKDHDYSVTGITEEAFTSAFPQAKRVGASFPVYLLEVDGETSEVAFARKEWKSGMGYHGFKFEVDPRVTIEDDLARRDTTMNAIAIDLSTSQTIDPFNGRRDIKDRTIRAINEHFCDDPTRALRAARQAAQHQATIHPYTRQMMERCASELSQEPTERILNELKLALASSRPSVFFTQMPEPLLKASFPEIHALIGKTQPFQHHPEGDAFNHTMIVLDKTASKTDDTKVRFCALYHDIGKGTTPPHILPHHYGHEKRGVEVIEEVNKRMVLPSDWKEAAQFVSKYHMVVKVVEHPGTIVKILFELDRAPITTKGFKVVCAADSKTNFNPLWLKCADDFIAVLKSQVRGDDAPSHLQGPQVGEWIHNHRAHLFKRLFSRLLKVGPHAFDPYR